MQPDKRRCYTFLGAALCRYHLDDIRALGGVNFFYVLNATKIDCLAPAFKEQRELLAHSMERLLQLRAVKQVGWVGVCGHAWEGRVHDRQCSGWLPTTSTPVPTCAACQPAVCLQVT